MSILWEERHLRQTEPARLGVAIRDPEDLPPQECIPKRIPPARARPTAPEPLPPFSDLVEIACQDCGGEGYDPGSVNTRELEDCPACRGSGKETILRNYLAEAFRIAADPEANLQLERAHVVALTAYARQTVSALMMSLSEVA